MSIVDVLYDEDRNKNSANDFFPGVTVGVVTDIDDPEGLGRLKVRLVNRDASNYETEYIRVMTPMTGQKWGSFFFPEVGDEVLVAFNQGDINRPYVLGSLWNKNYKPPTTIKDQKNDIRMIKTRSGHEIIFNDKEEEESLEIKTPQGKSVKMDDKEDTIVITDQEGKNILTIDTKNGKIDVEAEKKMTLKSGDSSIILDAEKNSISVESSASLNIKSNQIAISGKSTLEVSAGSSLVNKCDGPTTIKGATVKIN